MVCLLNTHLICSNFSLRHFFTVLMIYFVDIWSCVIVLFQLLLSVSQLDTINDICYCIVSIIVECISAWYNQRHMLLYCFNYCWVYLSLIQSTTYVTVLFQLLLSVSQLGTINDICYCIVSIIVECISAWYTQRHMLLYCFNYCWVSQLGTLNDICYCIVSIIVECISAWYNQRHYVTVLFQLLLSVSQLGTLNDICYCIVSIIVECISAWYNQRHMPLVQ